MYKPHKIDRGIVSMIRNEAPGDVKGAIEVLNKAFHDFKAEHKTQLDEHKKGVNDSLQAIKVDRINDELGKLQAAVDSANVKLAGLEMPGSGDGKTYKNKEHVDAVQAYMKSGEIKAALTKGSNPDGGYTVPTEWDRTIIDKLVLVSPMRQICGVQSISTNAFSKLFNLRGTASGWVGEAAARPNTANSTLGTLTYTTGEIYANPKATQQLLDDSLVDLEAWLSSEVETEFSYQENLAFVSGDGTNKPNGVLTYVTGGANAAAHPFGAITTVNSGAAGSVTADSVHSLIAALPEVYTQNARFIMNRTTVGAIRLLKDTTNQYLWQPSYQAGQPSTLAGYAITEVPAMPNVAAAAKPILFGDFKRGYLIVDRVGVRVLRDPYTDKPNIAFYTTKRVGGGVLNPEVIKAMNISV